MNLAVDPGMTRLHGDYITLPHLDVCFGLVEQSQRGVPAAVWSQRDERLQPLQAQAEMCSSVGRENTFYAAGNNRKPGRMPFQTDGFFSSALIPIKLDYKISSFAVTAQDTRPLDCPRSILIKMLLIHL